MAGRRRDVRRSRRSSVLNRIRGILGCCLKVRTHVGDARHGFGHRRELHDERGHAGKRHAAAVIAIAGGDLIGRVASRFLQRPAQ